MKWYPKSLALFLLSAACARAAGEEAPVAEKPLDLMQIFDDGGIMMDPLALLSLVAVVMILLFRPSGILGERITTKKA